MLALPHTNSWGFVYSNQTNGSITPGTSVTPGASDVEGSWTEIGPDASITSDIYYVTLCVHSGATSAAAKNHLLDFGWDPAGGTSYVSWFGNLAVGGSGTFQGTGGRWYHFPCYIPAGSAIAVRIQGSNATAGTVLVLASFYGKPSRPELWRPAAYTETLGFSSGSLGTSFTPGNATFGSWASLGTTTKKHFWGQLGFQVDNATSSTKGVRIQLGIGAGGSGDTHIISDSFAHTGAAELVGSAIQSPCAWEIPSGATLYVRANCDSAPQTGFNATAVLFGG